MRHHSIRDALISLLTMAGYRCQREHPIGFIGEGESATPLRMDIIATPPDGKAVYIDVTVANSAARSYAKKSDANLFAKQEQEKEKKYAEIAAANGCDLLTFSLTVFGRMSEKSRALLTTITSGIKARCSDKAERDTITFGATLNCLSKALSYGNGACLLFSNQLLTLYGVSLGAKPAAIRAPVGFRANSEDDETDALGDNGETLEVEVPDAVEVFEDEGDDDGAPIMGYGRSESSGRRPRPEMRRSSS